MNIAIESRHLGDVVLLSSKALKNERNFFPDAFLADQFKEPGLTQEFLQDNHSGSVRGVLRRLHF
jgi:dTDP-4-dehydrorhamnose 3,5-epimerase